MTDHYEPYFIIDQSADAETQVGLKRLEDSISDQPHIFATMLTKLGGLAFSEEARHQDLVKKELPPDQPAARLILDYFGKRFDREVEFDPQTETALAADEHHKQLLEEHKIRTNERRVLGHQSSESRIHPEAISGRDAVRLNRLAFYISRVVEAHALRPNDQPAPTSTAPHSQPVHIDTLLSELDFARHRRFPTRHSRQAARMLRAIS